MKIEVSTAANFVTSLLRSRQCLTELQLQHFSHSLEASLRERYQNHWFPSSPCRGSGYRCIRINHKMDPVIGQAASTIGLKRELVYSQLPKELTMWVDPYEVSYRIGEDGSIGVLYEAAPPSATRPNQQVFGDSHRERATCRNHIGFVVRNGMSKPVGIRMPLII